MKKKNYANRIIKKSLTATGLCFLALGGFAQSPYINKVYDFVPAPGQFVNELPEYLPGDTKDDMIRKAGEYIAQDAQKMVSLGGFGGYIVFGFEEPVENRKGYYDFRILGNAFHAGSSTSIGEGGSSEPGIVMVAYDGNGDGLPDNGQWYELAGSEHHKPSTLKDYRITYYRPDENKIRTPDNGYPYLNDTTYVRWTDNRGGSGYLSRNIYHEQPYYPQWTGDEAMTFAGTLLPPNAIDESGQGTYYVLHAYHWGYADNLPNSEARSCFDIGWATDASGAGANLERINLVKVYTGLSQYCGWLGETSTEIMGAVNLHAEGTEIQTPVFTTGITLDRQTALLNAAAGETTDLTATVYPADATNRSVSWLSSNKKVATVSSAGRVTALAEGTATITAYTNDGYYIATCTVTATGNTGGGSTGGGEVTSVQVYPAALEMKPGELATLTATVLPATAANKAVEWSSSAPQVAEVTVSGNVFACAPGTAVITAASAEGRHKATCLITVATPTATDRQTPGAQPAKMYYDGRALHLEGLDGYDCVVANAAGQAIAAFRITTETYSRHLPLPGGVYILAAQQGRERKIFKWMVRRGNP
ncbi:MAG: Ig-like domain-containing protein [Tannerellaceae bacterium]|jgi:uncharacterized protein YjdB|nr:Ig-like domain-containing protein [Tannerellaceae bacterium]